MPVKVLDLDLAEAAPIVPPAGRYDSVRVLVRDRTTPLGYVNLPNRVGELDRAAIVRAVADTRIGLSLWAGRALRRSRTLAMNGRPTSAEQSGLPPAISVVVCTRDRPAGLETCLAALARQSYPRFEVVVVDNGSRDRSTLAVAERFGARYVLESTPGLDFARNAGWRAARFPIVAYADDDTLPDPEWLRGIAEGFASPDVHAVTGLVVPAELETSAQVLFEDLYGGMGRGFALVVHSRRGREMTYWPHTYGVGCNMAFRRETLERLGGFDLALDVGTPTGGGGDLDMFQRVIESDLALCYRPDAVVRHVHRRTERQLRRQVFDNGRGFSAFMLAALGRARGLDRLRVLAHFAVWFGWVGGRVLRRIVRRDPLPLAFGLAELVGGLLGPLHYWRSRRRVRRLGSSSRGAVS